MRHYLLAAAPILLMACSHPARDIDVGSGQPAPQATPAGVSFAGTWVYNPDDSDHPGRYGMSGGGGFSGGRGGFGGRGGGGGFGGRGGGGGYGGRGGGNGDDRDAADSALRQPPGRLVIAQSDSTFAITPRDGETYALFFDGRDVTVTDAQGRSIGMNGRWHGKQFEIRRQLRNGAEMTESYELKKNGQRLVIHVRIRRPDNDTQVPEFERVYDKYGQ